MSNLGTTCIDRQALVRDVAGFLSKFLFTRPWIQPLCIRIESHLYNISKNHEDYDNRETLPARTAMVLDMNYARVAIMRGNLHYLGTYLNNWKHAARCHGCLLPHECSSSKMCLIHGKCLGYVRPHIAQCQEQFCAVPHCYVMRTLLAHVRACRAAECVLCTPFRNKRETLTVLSSLSTPHVRAHVERFPPVTAAGCGMCSAAALALPPPQYYCDGPCGSAIRRNALFNRSADDTRHLCQPCAPASAALARNAEECVDKTAECAECGRSVHYVCALIEPGVQPQRFVCPRCLLASRERLGLDCATVRPKPLKGRAAAYMEASVRAELPAEERGNVRVRLLARTAVATPVSDRVRGLFPDMPAEFPATESCFGLFNVLDGVDVLVFVFYALEYGADCPEPNRLRVYINYVDSVNYFQPKEFRTPVYRRMLLAYMQTASERGFKACHIWSCPPTRHDEYIFVGHPETQKKPAKRKLLEWYLATARLDSIPVTLMHDEFKDKTPPFFAGDLWALEITAGTLAAARAALKRNKQYCLVFHLEAGGTAPALDVVCDTLFKNRATFIQFCRMNHLQFSSLLFAKYATMVAMAAI
jgi:hypothetical protein